MIIQIAYICIGCGDGRLLIAAAKLGAKGVGFELHSELVHEARQAVERAGHSDLVKIVQQDAAQASVGEATVMMLYLSESGNTHMINNLKHKVPKRARVVSFAFPIQGYKSCKTEKVHGIEIHLYTKIGQAN